MLAFLIALGFSSFVLIAGLISSYFDSKRESKAVGGEFYGMKPRVSWYYPSRFAIAAFVLVFIIALITD